MFVQRRVTRNTGVGAGVGGCLGLVLLVALSWALIGLVAATFTIALWAVLVVLGLLAAWLLLWALPVAIYRETAAEHGRVGGALAAAGWITLVVALAVWIA